MTTPSSTLPPTRRGEAARIPTETRPLDLPDSETLITRLLAEQQTLTAVECYTRDHDNDILPAQAKYYSKLLPASPPGPDWQYAFEVDLDRCSGCKACVTACHSLNGLDEGETWRDVGLLIGGTASLPVMQHVTTACHHCLEPSCMTACPVDAYEKDPLTGIVKHLDDQCFGCQYCILACPYDVPKYHAGKGIVRKCDMCSDRLSVGEAPACVQACPHEAIAITLVEKRQVIENAEADHFLPAAPDPQITLPTTTFKTSRVFPRNTLPADYHAVSPQHAHWPLTVMLVLTQLSIGAFVIGLALDSIIEPALLTAFRPLHATGAFLYGLLAIVASTLHLGRPQYAFRAVIGLRHSWLSREILAFGLFAGAASIYAVLTWWNETGWSEMPIQWHRALGWTVAVLGIAGLFCSAMIYDFTRREFWRFPRTATKFVLTAVIMGSAATWLSLLLLSFTIDAEAADRLTAAVGRRLINVLLVAMAVKLVYEASLFVHLTSRRITSLKRSAQLLMGPLLNAAMGRFACGLLGGIIMPLFLVGELASDASNRIQTTIVVAIMFVACLAGELLERYQFFAAVAAPRMPGSF